MSHLLKVYRGALHAITASQHVSENISSFIEDVYNKKRLHSSLGYRPPIDFEKEVTLNSIA